MKLKPCPFCGSTKKEKALRILPSIGSDKKTVCGYRVVCEPALIPCGAEGPILGVKTKAVQAWNRRRV